MIEKMLCNKECLLTEVLRAIDESAKGTAFIVDDDNHLCGVLTDGDIRRLLLANENLSRKAGEVKSEGFVFAYDTETYDQMAAKINDKIRIIPVVDSEFRVVDVFEIKKLHLPVAMPNLKGKELEYLVDAFLSTWISSSGKYIERFEREFAEFCDCDHGIAVSNGTVAIHLALIALGIGAGDEVIVPDLTFAATINSVLHANATPVIVDIEHDSWCIDPEEIEKAITPRTKAIIPVHIYGQPCDMDKIMRIANRHGLFVVEDAAEAHGAKFAGKKVGSFGNIATFSFFGNKVITTGEGGMCVTNDPALAEKMRVLRGHGMRKDKKYYHDVVGYNYRMTNLQAAIGVAQLERIDDILKDREAVENEYRTKLSVLKGIKFQANDLRDREKITWLVNLTVPADKRGALMGMLEARGIETRQFFCSLSSMEIYKEYSFSNSVSNIISKAGISFPSTSRLGSGAVEKVLEVFREEGL